VLAAHGGSGASTLAAALGLPEVTSAGECQQLRLVVVTVRTTAAGFDRLLAVLSKIDPNVPVVVAASADAPLRAPTAVRGRARMLQRSGRRIALVSLPYQPAWRHAPAASQRPSMSYRRQLAKLSAAVHHHEGAPA
jgi:CMP-2-keto-3-deoxyoctulosonic acid synthetase